MVAIKGALMPRCCQNCFLIRYHDTLGYSCKATKSHITKSDVGLKRADDCPLVEIGTCKDCKHRTAIYADGDCFCEKDELLKPSTFYCADFEKRGNENEAD
jgi:hypothetical protein